MCNNKCREIVYTVLLLAVSLLVIFGGWFFTKWRMGEREKELLASQGRVYEIASRDDGGVSGTSEDVPPEGGTLVSFTEETLYTILDAWSQGKKELPHEPEGGQMDMEQALQTGREWIGTLAGKGFLPSPLSDCRFEKMNASLSAPETEGSTDRTLLGFWHVTYEKEDIRIILSIHALSGQVFDASISMNEERMQGCNANRQKLLWAAFPIMERLARGDRETVTKEGNVYRWWFPEQTVCAAAKREYIQIGSGESVARIRLWLDIRT